MFFSKTPLSFTPSLRGFFAVLSAGRFINAGYLSGVWSGQQKTFFSGSLGVSGYKNHAGDLSVCAFDLAFAVAFKSAGIYVIPVLSLMGETK